MIEDKIALLNKQLEATENEKSEYIKRYEGAINDKKKLTDEYMNRISDLKATCCLEEAKNSRLWITLESTKQESRDLRRKYEQVLSRQKAEEDRATSEIAALKSRSSAAEARLAAAREQAQSSQVEAEKWKRKRDTAFRDAKTAQEKAAAIVQRLETERLEQVERAEKKIESQVREKDDLQSKLLRIRDSEKDARSTVAKLREKLQQQEEELEALLDNDKTQGRDNAQLLEQLLEKECQAHARAKNRADGYSLRKAKLILSNRS